MSLDQGILSMLVAALAVVVVALAAWMAVVHRSQASLRRRLRRVFTDGDGQGLDEILDRVVQRLDQTGQRVGVVRFNPFSDTGGDQSFAIALLDSEGNGIVLSSLHGRTDTRVFAKPVSAGRSRHALSDEEQEAIRRALTPAERPG